MNDHIFLYFSVMVPWEPNPAKRTVWHPDTPTGPFSTLSRGAFRTTEAARSWAREHLGAGANYYLLPFVGA